MENTNTAAITNGANGAVPLIDEQLDVSGPVLAAMLDSIEHHVWWKSHDGRILGCNDAFARSVGLSTAADAVGLTDRDLDLPPAQIQQFEDEDELVRTTGTAILNREKAIDLGTDTIHVSVSKIPVFDDDGGYAGMVGLAVDVTSRRELEAQVSEASKFQALGQLAAGVAHEINTPVQYVTDNLSFLSLSSTDLIDLVKSSRAILERLGSLIPDRAAADEVRELLERYERADVEFLAEEVPRALEQSLEGTKRVTKIVRALKEFAHPGGDEPEPTDVNRLVESTVSVASNEWKYVAEVELDLQADLPLVPCQPAQLAQVILVLMVNAAQAIGEAFDESAINGRISVSTRVDARDLHLSVEDNGCGIADDVMPRIFDPFFTTKEVGVGSGQGLSLAHNIITNNHRGSLTVESQAGVGTTVTVTIPLTAATEVTTDE